MPHILYVHHRSELAGAERSLLALFSRIDRSRFQISIACPAEGRLVDELGKLDVPHHAMSFGRLRDIPRMWRSTCGLRTLISRHRIDVVHSNGPQTNLPAALAGRFMAKPVVWHERVLVEPTETDWDRLLAGLPSRIVCNSESIRSRFTGIADFESKVVTILNGVDTHWYVPQAEALGARAQIGIGPSFSVIGCFDRLDPVKNHEVILHALQLFQKTVPSVVLLLVGEALVDHGRRRRALEDLARALGIGSVVRFLGFVEDVRIPMAASDVIVQASLAEGSSRVLCEAAAMGKPVVASSVGGNPELVVEGRTGLLFPPTQPDRLAECLIRLLVDESLRAVMGRQAREWALERLSLDRYCRQIESVYDTCGRSRSKGP